MIRGIGTDIIAVARIQRTIERNPRFVERVYTEAETAYCQAKANPWQSYAVRFAAKEAVMKAFGTGWDGKINWRDIEVGLDVLGKPEILLHGGARARFQQTDSQSMHISLSHEQDFAVAFAVWEC